MGFATETLNVIKGMSRKVAETLRVLKELFFFGFIMFLNSSYRAKKNFAAFRDILS